MCEEDLLRMPLQLFRVQLHAGKCSAGRTNVSGTETAETVFSSGPGDALTLQLHCSCEFFFSCYGSKSFYDNVRTLPLIVFLR